MTIRALQPKGGTALKLWHVAWTPVAGLLAFGPLVLVNLAQLLSLLILPWSRPAYRRYNRGVAALIWGYWAWAIDKVVGTKLELSGDELPYAEDAIVIANHQEMADILVILCLAATKGRVGDAKWAVKDVLKYVPGVGWGMVFLGCLFLKRNWADDEANILRTFSRFVDGRIPLWMISFPEGTRRTPAKLQASREYALKAGLPPLQHVLLPRARGFSASVQGLRQHVRAVYSLTIRYDGQAPTLMHMVRGDVARVRIFVKRTPIAALPRDHEGLSSWLIADFQRHDGLLEGNLSS